jgi:hypothetical protein
MTARVITANLMGGLGNQLFQIFTTIAYGIDQQRKIIFPYTDVLTTGKIRNTYWESFLMNLKHFTTTVIAELEQYPHYRERSFRYEPIPSISQSHVKLYGYFQSYKYFEKYEDQLFKMIKLDKQLATVKIEYSQLFNHIDNTISMHFRLGDYKLHPNMHPIMPFYYYYDALDHIISTRKNYDDMCTIRILYFCEKEDIEQVNVIINKLKMQPLFSNFAFIKVDDSIEDWKQMLLMSCCNDNIIANSTFSWWGGYFNRMPNKIVCYPSTWFGPASNNVVDDLFPSSWHKIVL